MTSTTTDDERYLTGKHAIVTGGGRGIGAAVATALARRGAILTLMSRSKKALDAHADSLRSECGATVGTIECDVTDDRSIAKAFAQAVAERGKAYVLINNAGAAESAPFAQTTRDIWDRMLAVNLTSTYSCCVQVLPSMIEAKAGRIVNVASTAGLRGYKTMTAYCAAKHGVLGLTKALAQEAAKHGVTVNAVCPGYTETDIVDQAISNLVSVTKKGADEARAMLERTVARGTLITPEEVASAVAWLCAPGASGVSGVALPIAGGAVP